MIIPTNVFKDGHRIYRLLINGCIVAVGSIEFIRDYIANL